MCGVNTVCKLDFEQLGHSSYQLQQIIFDCFHSRSYFTITNFFLASQHLSGLEIGRCSREPRGNDASNDRWHDKDAEHNADGAAAEQAAIAVDLAAHSWAYKLFEHSAGVEREGKTANRRRQEWVLIWLLSCGADLIFLSVVKWNDFDLNAHETIVFHLALVILGGHRDKEALSIFLPLIGCVALLEQISLIVLLVDT